MTLVAEAGVWTSPTARCLFPGYRMAGTLGSLLRSTRPSKSTRKCDTALDLEVFTSSLDMRKDCKCFVCQRVPHRWSDHASSSAWLTAERDGRVSVYLACDVSEDQTPPGKISRRNMAGCGSLVASRTQLLSSFSIFVASQLFRLPYARFAQSIRNLRSK